MTVKQIYEKYKTPKNLQEHMLRVAALAKIICDNYTGKNIHKLRIIKACTLHDIAKPMTFNTSIENLSKYGQSLDEQNDAIRLKEFIIKTYGPDEHIAAIGMCRDIGMNKDAIRVLDNLEWKFTNRLLTDEDIESLIAVYCDRRIGPKGLLSLQQRLDDLKARSKVDYYDDYVKSGEILENKLQKVVSTDLNSITDEDLNSLFSTLLNLEI